MTDNLESLWPRVRARLRASVGEEAFNAWMGRLKIEGVSGGIEKPRVLLSVPTKFLSSWITQNYKDRLTDAFSAEGVAGSEIKILGARPMKTAAEAPVETMQVDPNAEATTEDVTPMPRVPMQNPELNRIWSVTCESFGKSIFLNSVDEQTGEEKRIMLLCIYLAQILLPETPVKEIGEYLGRGMGEREVRSTFRLVRDYCNEDDELDSHLIQIQETYKQLGAAKEQPKTKGVTIKLIQTKVAKYFEISRESLISEHRYRELVRPRQIAMYLSKDMTIHSLPEIGREFGGRDHSTVLYSVRQIEKFISTDKDLAGEVEDLRSQILEAAA